MLNDDEDGRIHQTISDMWEFVINQKWISFSIIGASGGGLFALAFLSSYMDRVQQNLVSPNLRAVCIVAGICCSAGVEDMMKPNQQMFHTVTLRKTSIWATIRFHSMFYMQGLIFSILPIWLVRKIITMDAPVADKDILQDDVVGPYIVRSLQHALCQHGACHNLEQEACVIFRSNIGFYKNLQSHFSMENDTKYSPYFPRVAIYQGLQDKNVPYSHSKFVYEQLLNSKAIFITYNDLAHFSLIVQKAAEYAFFAVTGSEDFEASSMK
jgi:pimeloyl-ACP methyl ester carboxylesterase